MKKKLLLLAFVPFVLTACPDNGGGVTPPPGPVEEEHGIGYRYEDLGSDPDFEEINENCSVGGFFTDLSVGRFCAENTSYEMKITSKLIGKPKFTVTSSHEEHLTVIHDENDTSGFTIETHTAGDSILTVYNELDAIIYRNVVRVRPKYTQTTILDLMYETDSYDCIGGWERIFGDTKFTLTSNDTTVSGVLKGVDDSGFNFTNTFDLVYRDYYESVDLYAFTVTNLETDSPDTRIIEIDVASAGDIMYVYYGSGSILAILHNCEVSYIFGSQK